MSCPLCGGEITLLKGSGQCLSCGWEARSILERRLREFESVHEDIDNRRKEISLWHLYGCGSGAAQTLFELGLLNEEEWVKWVEALGAAAGFESERREASSETSMGIDQEDPAD